MPLFRSTLTRKISCFLFLTSSSLALSSFVQAMNFPDTNENADDRPSSFGASVMLKTPAKQFKLRSLEQDLKTAQTVQAVNIVREDYLGDTDTLITALSLGYQGPVLEVITNLPKIVELFIQAYRRATGITDVEEGKRPRVEKKHPEKRLQDHSKIGAEISTILRSLLPLNDASIISSELGRLLERNTRLVSMYTNRYNMLIELHNKQPRFTRVGYTSYYYYIPEELIFLTHEPGVEEARDFFIKVNKFLGSDDQVKSPDNPEKSGPITLEKDKEIWGSNGNVLPATLELSQPTRDLLGKSSMRSLLVQYHTHYFVGLPIELSTSTTSPTSAANPIARIDVPTNQTITASPSQPLIDLLSETASVTAATPSKPSLFDDPLGTKLLPIVSATVPDNTPLLVDTNATPSVVAPSSVTSTGTLQTDNSSAIPDTPPAPQPDDAGVQQQDTSVASTVAPADTSSPATNTASSDGVDVSTPPAPQPDDAGVQQQDTSVASTVAPADTSSPAINTASSDSVDASTPPASQLDDDKPLQQEQINQ